MSFEISVGAGEPQDVQKQIDSNNIVIENWNNCKHRSEKHEYEVQSCCRGLEKHTGYVCYKLEIKDLTPIVCSRCGFCENKNQK